MVRLRCVIWVFSAPAGGTGSIMTIENPIDDFSPSNSQSVKPKDEDGFVYTSIASFLPYLSCCLVQLVQENVHNSDFLIIHCVRATPSNIPKQASCGLYKNSGSGEMRLMG